MKEKLKMYIEKMGWSYVENIDIIKIDVEGGSISWTMFIKTDQKDSFCCFSVLPARITQDKMQTISQLTNVYNSEIWFGNFELIMEGDSQGQLRLRTSSFVPDTADEKTSDLLIENTIAFNIAAMNRYSPLFLKALYSEDN